MPQQLNISLSGESAPLYDDIQAYAVRVGTSEPDAMRRLARLGLQAVERAGSARPAENYDGVRATLDALSDELERVEQSDPAAGLGLTVGAAVALVRHATQRGLTYGLSDDGVMRPAIEVVSASLADVAVNDPARGQRCADQLATGVGAWAASADSLAS